MVVVMEFHLGAAPGIGRGEFQATDSRILLAEGRVQAWLWFVVGVNYPFNRQGFLATVVDISGFNGCLVRRNCSLTQKAELTKGFQITMDSFVV